MPKKILLIENDSAFAAQISESLESSGFDVRVAPEGKGGLDLAREWGPDAVVLCVELPGMSGYLVCQKLRKEEATRALPLILTSAEATPDTFEKHRALKVRADEYLFKPYVPGDLLAKLAAIGLPAEAPAEALEEEPAGDAEELVSLEEEMGLEALAQEPEGELPPFDLQSLPDEPGPAASASPGLDDLSLLDEAFDGLAPSRPADPGEALELELGGGPAGDEAPAAGGDEPFSLGEDGPLGDENPLGDLTTDADAALGALGMDSGADEGPGLELDPEPEQPIRGASAGALRAAGIHLLDDPAPAPAPIRAAPTPPPPAPESTERITIPGLRRPVLDLPTPAARAERAEAPEPRASAASSAAVERLERELADARHAAEDARAAAAARDTELRQLRQRADDSARRADEAEAALSERDADLASLRAKLETITGQARKAETELKTVREEARRSADEAYQARGRVEEIERRAAQADQRVQAAERRAEAAERRADEAQHQAAESTERIEAAEAEVVRRQQEVDGVLQRLEATERELDGLRTDLVVARGEVEGARSEVEKRTAELRKRISELEAAGAKNEERVLKAYQKIKGDEKVKDKVRKAIAIAAQLLEEGLPPEAPAEKPRSGAAVLLERE
ncbi:MAG: response regulator [Anaeromyxobacter sp.]